MISKKHSESSRKTILKVIASGKSIHRLEENGRWKGGITIKGNYPCPMCGKELLRAKRYETLRCSECARNNKKPRTLKKKVTRSAYYWRARMVIKKSGVEISSNEHVHHKNGDWTDNRIENLEVISKYEHRRKYHNPKSKEFVC